VRGPYPRVVIAGPASGAGKTTVAVGLMAAYAARGFKVQGFKVGPDYIDPGFYASVTGRPGRNLDLWLMGEENLAPALVRGMRGADLAVVEGVMGLYDGLGASTWGSTAHVAKILRAPVLLVLNARGLAASAAALVEGYRSLDREVRLAGVVLTRTGGARHAARIREAVEGRTGVPVLGHLEHDPGLELPERHLGLLPVSEHPDPGPWLARVRQAVKAGLDLDRILELAVSAGPPEGEGGMPAPDRTCLGGDGTDRSQAPFPFLGPTRSPEGPLIAVARDRAFHFYYPENLEALEAAGARLAFFSPLADASLPSDTRGIYIGGGFPEVFAGQLAENRALRTEVRAAVGAGIPVLAECGGLMYLCRSLEVDGRSYPMVGVVPAAAVFTRRLQRCGYVTAVALRDTCLGACGTALRGHVFHYSRLIPEGGWPAAFRLVRSDGTEDREGMVYRNVLASFVHFHFAGHPEAARRFVACAAGETPGVCPSGPIPDG